jgi:hypothetical protein
MAAGSSPMKTMQGAQSAASLNRSRTFFSDSPADQSSIDRTPGLGLIGLDGRVRIEK